MASHSALRGSWTMVMPPPSWKHFRPRLPSDPAPVSRIPARAGPWAAAAVSNSTSTVGPAKWTGLGIVPEIVAISVEDPFHEEPDLDGLDFLLGHAVLTGKARPGATKAAVPLRP